MKKDQLLRIMEAVFESARGRELDETSAAISEMTESTHAGAPFAIRVLSRRPDVCIASMIKNLSLLSNEEILDPKVAELIAISSAVANRCEFCLSIHMEKARSLGARMVEIFQTILISSAICESSAWAVAFREFKKFEAKERRTAKIHKQEGSFP